MPTKPINSCRPIPLGLGCGLSPFFARSLQDRYDTCAFVERVIRADGLRADRHSLPLAQFHSPPCWQSVRKVLIPPNHQHGGRVPNLSRCLCGTASGARRVPLILPAGARRATLAWATPGGLTNPAVTYVCHRRFAIASNGTCGAGEVGAQCTRDAEQETRASMRICPCRPDCIRSHCWGSKAGRHRNTPIRCGTRVGTCFYLMLKSGWTGRLTA